MILIKKYWNLSKQDKEDLKKFETIELSFSQKVINKIYKIPNRLLTKIYLLYVNNHIIGFCVVMFDSIIGLFIKSEFQRKGYGSKLLSFVISDMQQLHSKILVKPINNSENFYKKFGFMQVNKFYVLKRKS